MNPHTHTPRRYVVGRRLGGPWRLIGNRATWFLAGSLLTSAALFLGGHLR